MGLPYPKNWPLSILIYTVLLIRLLKIYLQIHFIGIKQYLFFDNIVLITLKCIKSISGLYYESTI